MIDVNLDGVFDELLDQMQGEDQRKKMLACFHATPKELGEAAVAGAERETLVRQGRPI